MKKIYALTFILGILSNLHAQKAGEVDSSFATNGIHVEPSTLFTDDAEIEIDSNGKIFVGATVILNKDTTAFVMRFNSDGTKDLSFNGTSASILNLGSKGAYLKDMNVLSDGKIILCGYYSDSQECFVARLTSTGEMDATFGIGGFITLNISTDSNEGAFNIEPYIGDSYLISGLAYETNITKGYDVFLTKILNNGIIDNTFNGGNPIFYDYNQFDDYNVALLVEANNKIVLSGYFDNTDYNTRYLSLQRINPDGTKDPSINFGTSANDIAIYNFSNGIYTVLTDVIKDANGGFFLTGALSETGVTNYNSFIINVNSDGSLNRDFGLENPYYATTQQDMNVNSGSDMSLKALLLKDNSLVMVGLSPNNSDGNIEVYLLGLNQDGTINTNFGNSGITFLDIQGGEDRTLDAAYSADENKIYVTGKSWNEDQKRFELFLTAFHTENVISSINELGNDNLFDVYPNPASNEIQITLKEKTDYESEISVFNANGVEILKQKIKSDKTILDIARLPKGLYFVSLNINSQIITRTLIKQ